MAPQTNIYVSAAVRNAGPPVSYTESIAALTGEIMDENGLDILDENDDAIQSDDFVLSSTQFDGTVTQYQGRVLFTQNGQEIAAGSGYVSSGVLRAPEGIDFSALDINKDDHIINIIGVGGDAVTASYKILQIQSDELILNRSTTGTGDVTYKVVAAPIFLNPETQETEILEPTAGTVPTGSVPITSYRDRLVWALDRVWYMSRGWIPRRLRLLGGRWRWWTGGCGGQ